MKTLFPLLIIGSCLLAQAADPPLKKPAKPGEQATDNLILAVDAAKPVNEKTPRPSPFKQPIPRQRATAS